MKRKRSPTLFFWSEDRNGSNTSKQGEESDSETVVIRNGPQLGLMLKKAPHFENSLLLPYELMIKIFRYVVKFSEHPVEDLFRLSRVCETWRQIVLKTSQLWGRLDLTRIPTTDRNILILDKIFKDCPNIQDGVREVSFSGGHTNKNNKVVQFYESLFEAPNLIKLYLCNMKPQSRNSFHSLVPKSLHKCKNLRSLSIIESRQMFSTHKWLSDHLFENGSNLEELNLAMSLTMISSQLFKAISSEFCPKLKILDISTCDALTTHSFDAVQLAQNMPNLEVLRVANVSFKRVQEAPDNNTNLPALRELSMPIGMRDADRDDALLGTLTYGSRQMRTLDLRGSSVSASALINMPSPNLRELHIDDTCPLMRGSYHRFIEKWSHSLEVLSFVKVNCDKTVEECLRALIEQNHVCKIRELDLTASQVKPEVLKKFITLVKSLENVNLTSCRSLPRGCKGLYSKKLDNSLSFKVLMKRLR